MYLGSCRYKLPHYLDDDSPYVFIFKQFETYHIEAFFYIGGNDSMDTVLKLSEYGNASAVPSALSASRRPSTMISARPITPRALALPQNTLPPSLLEIAHDTFIYAVKSVTIVEIMGRDAGWLTAAAALAQRIQHRPHLIYLPEVAFDPEDFLLDVKRLLFRAQQCHRRSVRGHPRQPPAITSARPSSPSTRSVTVS